MRALLGLGGNLGDVRAAFATSRTALARRFRVVGASGLWVSAPLGPPQSDFLNAALLVDGDVDPLRLLAVCQRLEAEAGRDRTRQRPAGPRPLDIDLLLVPGVVVCSPALTVPHPRLAERRFAVQPAAELVPSWVHPRLHVTVAALAAALERVEQRCERAGVFPS